MRVRETLTSRGIVTPGRAERARRMALSICARAPNALGLVLIVRVGLITRGRGRSKVLRTRSVASRGVSQPTRTGPMLTPGAISGRFAGAAGGRGTVEVVEVEVVVSVEVVPVSAPAAPADTTNAAPTPRAAQATSEAAPAAKSVL